MSKLQILDVNFDNNDHADALLKLLNDYACDPMGGSEPLTDFCRTHLISALKHRPNVCAVIAWYDGEPAGFSICMEGFSTFACQPLLNIHDFAVSPPFRGKGIASALMQYIENIAKKRGSCKLTLEVLEGNQVARHVYQQQGFAQYALGQTTGGALMMQKKLSD